MGNLKQVVLEYNRLNITTRKEILRRAELRPALASLRWQELEPEIREKLKRVVKETTFGRVKLKDD